MSYTVERTAAAFVHDNANKVGIFRDPAITNTAVPVLPNGFTSGTKMNLYGWALLNPNATAVFFKIYDSPADPPIVPPILTLQVAANGQVVFFGSDPIAFEFDMYIKVTTGYLDADNTAPATACIATVFAK